MDASTTTRFHGFELRFCSLFHEGRGYAFPCDPAGHVPLEELTERARENYLRVQALVGREFATPVMLPADVGH